jgi:hypothetical protein
MTISLAPVTGTLLEDDFADGAQLSSATWSYPTGPAAYIPPEQGPWGTETEPYLPSVSDGALQLTLQTYNPTSQPPGDSFLGSAIYTDQSFSPDSEGESDGIAFTVVAKLDTTVPGMDGGIFPYFITGANSHNEIDYELYSDDDGAQPTEVSTNIYNDAPFNSAGNPSPVPDPSLTAYQTYTIEWFPNEVLWFIDGQLVLTNTIAVPQGSMQLYLNFWASDALAGGPLQPTANPADNTTYTFDVASVSVTTIQNNTLPTTPRATSTTTACPTSCGRTPMASSRLGR